MVRIDDEEILKVWDTYSDQLRGRLRTLAGHSAPVEDLMQDLFVKVYPKASRLQVDFALRYLMTAASNLARDYLRRIRRKKVPAMQELKPDPTPFDSYRINEKTDLYTRRVRPLIEHLPKPKREAIELLLDGRPRAHLARELRIPPSTLRSRQLAGIDLLRKHLGYSLQHQRTNYQK